jgi:hypothetical protein
MEQEARRHNAEMHAMHGNGRIKRTARVSLSADAATPAPTLPTPGVMHYAGGGIFKTSKNSSTSARRELETVNEEKQAYQEHLRSEATRPTPRACEWRPIHSERVAETTRKKREAAFDHHQSTHLRTLGQVKLRVQGVTYSDEFHVPVCNNDIDMFTLDECKDDNRPAGDFYMLQVYNAVHQSYRKKIANECKTLFFKRPGGPNFISH